MAAVKHNIQKPVSLKKNSRDITPVYILPLLIVPKCLLRMKWLINMDRYCFVCDDSWKLT